MFCLGFTPNWPNYASGFVPIQCQRLTKTFLRRIPRLTQNPSPKPQPYLKPSENITTSIFQPVLFPVWTNLGCRQFLRLSSLSLETRRSLPCHPNHLLLTSWQNLSFLLNLLEELTTSNCLWWVVDTILTLVHSMMRKNGMFTNL